MAGMKMQNFNENFGQKFSLSSSPSRNVALLGINVHSRRTSDGFHVQIDKFSSVCINYVLLSFFLGWAETFDSMKLLGGQKVLQSFLFVSLNGHTTHSVSLWWPASVWTYQSLCRKLHYFLEFFSVFSSLRMFVIFLSKFTFCRSKDFNILSIFRFYKLLFDSYLKLSAIDNILENEWRINF